MRASAFCKKQGLRLHLQGLNGRPAAKPCANLAKTGNPKPQTASDATPSSEPRCVDMPAILESGVHGGQKG